MWGIVTKLFLVAIGIVVVFYSAAHALRNARRLDRRIQEFKKEQEEREKQGVPFNPYAALAELYTEDPPPKSTARRK